MNGKKTTISSVLCQNFGIEDFESGVVTHAHSQESINNYELANKLGLLSSLSDRSDNEIVTFGAEAYNLLGEANWLNQYATNKIEAINERFAIANEIKKNYGVEGFDPFAFGCEGFKDKIKSAFTAVVAVIKKIIQSITNWIRQVMNWIGSQFAKTQQKLVDKYKSLKFVENGAMIKAILPISKIPSGEALFTGFNVATGIIVKNMEKVNDHLQSSMMNASTVTLTKATAKTKGAQKDSVTGQYSKATYGVKGGLLAVKDFYKEGNNEIKSYYGKKINVVKIGSATKVANELVWGLEEPKKIPVKVSLFLSKVEWKVILSKADLKCSENLVKDGKAIIKAMNSALKVADKLSKSLAGGFKQEEFKDGKYTRDKKGAVVQKDLKLDNEVKRTREQIRIMTANNRLASIMSGVLYGSFANYLKLRSYTASAIREYVSAVGKKGTSKKPNHGYNANQFINNPSDMIDKVKNV